MTGLLASLTGEERRLWRDARPGREPAARPMQATLSDRRDFAGGWVFARTSWTGFVVVRCPMTNAR
ncbi:putative protein OS=Streptomyces aurantiogriseus OX=66870 GN=GCM10010251_89400 PE=4 SV=1 [Streptomyces aurantiogriseus]|uniref:Uncharacterized protein n=1 Tax=Streptomyces aurantiogriseus TaxID=66870 RepID=A0A918FN12_9ACTN|nr:hypothetical protein GCM10010251_89400 [Streptomyces aurantiogriseus]